MFAGAGGQELAEDLARETAAAVDTRFADLMSPAAWAALPASIQKRFSRRLPPGATLVYEGDLLSTDLSRAGRLLAFFARAIGAPLPLHADAIGAAIVMVAEDPAAGGQTWTRIYGRAGHFPQVINSIKQFAGPTGLQEYLGSGLSMLLTLHEEHGALVFRSAGYSLRLFGRALVLPRWLGPGQCEVVHRDEPGSRFSFTLSLTHRLFGRLIHQVAIFKEEVK